MKKLMLWMLALAAAPGGALFAQNIVGSWQGTLNGPPGRPGLRIVVKFSRADDEKLKAVLYSIDQGGQPINASAASLQGSTLKMSVNAIGGEYEGKVGSDGNSIAGTWTQGPQPMPLNFVRETPQTAWAIPEPAPPPKLMPADAKPHFEVATIKPSQPDAKGSSILVGRGGSNLFTTTNTTLKDLIVFAYGLHARQVTGGPAWIENDKYDLSGKPDLDGIPNVDQLKAMLQQLLTERFQIASHREKKELSVYAITVAKTGLKINKTENGGGNLPGFGGRGPGNIFVRNSNMTEFAGFLQSRIVDRPVVDQTALTGKYDFSLKWTPDASEPAVPGQPAAAPAATDADAPPDLFAAFQQQLGLRLESTKAPVEVLVVDKVEKPSDN
ncbi:MAG: TIGR03435 family protein [Bryobacteraceae bacterium]|jgi:uncharacterized protein (TIGR03435 family)